MTVTELAQEFVKAEAAKQANAALALYGISGSGKSSLADTAAEYAFETFGKITLCYAADLGGFGNKRLMLIRAGIIRVWDPRNHVNPFETMELMSLGGFPETLIDPETGYAAPDVKILLPRRLIYQMYCPQGHVVAKDENQAVFGARTFVCPTCGVPTNVTNAQRVEKTVVRHRLFKDVGLRIYDSFTALNEWGMNDLQAQSAKGLLPVGSSGGSALGGADALRSGTMAFSTGSKAQYGFLQNRSYGWLSNIKTIPDQVVPAVCTFMVETSRTDDESGGEQVLGPKIAGSARTAAVAGWVGNLLHATKEPGDDGTMRYRLWLTNHIDPRDPRKIPYLAKHRGTPLGMPDYLEDAPGAAPWSGCSLQRFFTLLNEQLAAMEAERATKYPAAPGIWSGETEGDVDEVVGGSFAGSAGVAPGAGGTGPASVGVPATTATPAVRTVGRTLRRAGAPMPVAATGGFAAPAPVAGAPAAPSIDTALTAQVDAGAAPEPITVATAVTVPASIETATAEAPSPVAQESTEAAARVASASSTPPASPPQPSVAASSVAPPGPRRRLARPPV